MKTLLRLCLAALVAALTAASAAVAAAAAPPAAGQPVVSSSVQHDVSPPLSDLPSKPPSPVRREKPVRRLPSPGAPAGQTDPVLQSSATAPLVATTAGLNFAGVGNGDYGFVPNAAPPDTNGAVGATQFVQWVNESFAVFDKATGSILPGFPKTGNTLWSGFGGGCETNNDGDPIVQYDKAAGRWVLSQFSVSTTPYLQCVAVSTTSDATGTYNRYAFSYGLTQFPDYPKLGVWPDAYYISFNIFNNGVSFAGAKACAYDRAAMLAGAATATQVCFQLSTSFGGLLPSDLDGATAPPTGSPNYFLNFGANSLNLWKFHADFATPASSTFVGPTSVPVAAFNEACGGGTCIPQPGTTQQLDSLGDRLMYRLAYRNFGDHESLVVNHSVAAGSSVGVRWYELRSPGGTPAVFQQGTYAPDASFRWMGSVAMDRAGDIAVGYSVSSSALAPSIRYTGRAPSDPLGTLQAENALLTGGGSQLPNLSRWGDYSSISVDPADDCTFWYTTEYLKTSGTFNWSTRVGSFSFPGCSSGASAPVVTGLNPTQGSTDGGTSVTITGSNFTGASRVAFGSLAATSFTVNSASQITATAPAQAAGTVDVTVTTPAGTSATSTADQFTYVASAPASFSMAAAPSSRTVPAGASATYSVTLTAINGYNAAVNLSLSNLPVGATASFNPNPLTPTAAGASSTLTVVTSDTDDTPPGTYTLTITGAGSDAAATTRTTTVTLAVQ